MKQLKSNPEKILIYRLGSLGDTIVALPSLHWIRSRFPRAEITLLTNWPVNGKSSAASTVLDSVSLVDRYLAYPVGIRNVGALIGLRREIARHKFSLVFALSEARGRGKAIRDWLFFRSCAIPKVIGSPMRRRDFVCMPSGCGNLYEPEALRLARRIGAEGQIDLAQDRWWNLGLSPTERSIAADQLGQNHASTKFIAFSLGTKSEVNDWTMPNWRSLVTELGRRYRGLALVGLGVIEECEKTNELLRLWPGGGVNLCGVLTPRLSGAVLERALMFIGHDSGPMHLAAAVGTKCVAIFSGRNPPGQWFPRGTGHRVLYHHTECFNCNLLVCQHQAKKCILSISVEEVLSAVEQVLKQALLSNRHSNPNWTADQLRPDRVCA